MSITPEEVFAKAEAYRLEQKAAGKSVSPRTAIEFILNSDELRALVTDWYERGVQLQRKAEKVAKEKWGKHIIARDPERAVAEDEAKQQAKDAKAAEATSFQEAKGRMKALLDAVDASLTKPLAEWRSGYLEQHPGEEVMADAHIAATREKVSNELARRLLDVPADVVHAEHTFDMFRSGELEGSWSIIFADGTRKRIETRLIYAGGYNIQRLHTSYLVQVYDLPSMTPVEARKEALIAAIREAKDLEGIAAAFERFVTK